jgi:hypothetical protein
LRRAALARACATFVRALTWRAQSVPSCILRPRQRRYRPG